MQNNNIYVFKNFGFKYKSIAIWTAVIASIAVFVVSCAINKPEVLIIIPVMLIMGYIFSYKMPMANTLNYKTIIVDNNACQLKFVSAGDYEEIFKYSEMKNINWHIKYEPMSRRSVIFLEIYLTNGVCRNISFTNYEFSLAFLKKLPSSVPVAKLPSAFPLWIFFVLVGILAFVIAFFQMQVLKYTGG